MSWQWSPGGVLTVTGAVTVAMLAALAWRRRSGVDAAWLALVLVAAAAWGLAYGLELASPTVAERQAWGDVKYVGICALPVAWVMFVSAYTGRTAWHRPRTILLLAIEPVLVLGMLANRSTHDLIRYYPAGSAAQVASNGALFWAHSVYTYVVLWGATALLVVRLGRMSPVYRRQAAVLVVSLAVPFVLNLLFNLGVPPFDTVDLTPFAFLGAAVVLVWGVTRLHLVRLRPVARSEAFTKISDLVIALDSLARVIDVNGAASAAFGVPARQLLGQDIATLLPRIRGLLAGAGGGEPVEETIGGRVYELQASPLNDRRSRRLGTLLLGHDVTDRKNIEWRLARQALHDPLTDAPNRALFFERLTHALDHASRTGHPVAVLFLDLDLFKEVNDKLGHAAGDAVLVEVARRLRARLRKGDTVARMGGDEFAILLEDITGTREPQQVAMSIHECLGPPIEVDGHCVTVTASIGFASGLNLPADELVRQADQRMYEAKRDRPHPSDQTGEGR